ncbi:MULTISPECIES: tRNA (cytidine(34)-2'-O)-methyltransferase [unclassified Mesorhizobium]|uniref:tRNA (cytidine(34)-2'-O)-methyltransferase n=1 Tax=unclassified Mesorhizobium TaxID=325217 RepID=UPI0013E366B6|nr:MULTISPECIES: tRNA (cytidine(34)-2'-O)-methyltransferase [unclassified Mesorhizobium]
MASTSSNRPDFRSPTKRSSEPAWTTSKWLPRHVDWHAFEEWRKAGSRRLVLLSTKATTAYTSFIFAEGDILLFGRESAGVPDPVHQAADTRLTIPMQGTARSINVALSVAMVAGEAVRQLG